MKYHKIDNWIEREVTLIFFVKDCRCSNTKLTNEVIALMSHHQINNLKFLTCTRLSEFRSLVFGKRGSIISESNRSYYLEHNKFKFL